MPRVSWTIQILRAAAAVRGEETFNLTNRPYFSNPGANREQVQPAVEPLTGTPDVKPVHGNTITPKARPSIGSALVIRRGF